MMRRSLVLILFLTVWMLPCQKAFAAGGLSEPIAQKLKDRIGEVRTQQAVFCRHEFLCGSSLIPRFYKERDFRPAWIDDQGLNSQGEDLITMILTSPLEGLTPEDYHIATIESITYRIKNDRNWKQDIQPLADLDMLLTDAFLIYASHLLAGRVDPLTIHTKWIAFTRKADLVQLLHIALAMKSVETTLKYLRPPHAGYEQLRKALKRYRTIVSRGGWPVIPPGPKLRKGIVSNRVKLLRHHLILTGDCAPGNQNTLNVFTADLERAVRTYQRRHGLVTDGIVGPRTLAHLNVSADKRLRQIIVNMERWRWLPHDLGYSYILVNIADFRLDVMEGDTSIMHMRVVVGTSYRRTPVFSGSMKYLVINPFWSIPTKLVAEDIYPMVKRNPHYLATKKIRVFENWRGDAPEIDYEKIDWSRLKNGTFPYKLRQEPGPRNPLGRIKFVFPNKFAVYLHDTPHRGLFNMNKRGFSSGCIRIEKPIDLAAYLLQDDQQWSREILESIIASGETKEVYLAHKIPVHLLYWTAWVDCDSLVHFRDDLYERDDALYEALMEMPPRS